MSEFWNRAVQTQQPAQQAPLSLGEQQKAYMRQFSASQMYAELPPTPEQRAAAQPQRYVERYAGLQSYQQAPASRWAWDAATSSPTAYVAKLKQGGLLRADGVINADNFGELAPHDQAAIRDGIEKLNSAEAGDHDSLRAVLSKRADGNGAQQTGHRVDASQRFGPTREIEREGHLAADASNLAGVQMASMADVAAARRAAEQQYVPQRSAELAARMGAVR